MAGEAVEEGGAGLPDTSGPCQQAVPPVGRIVRGDGARTVLTAVLAGVGVGLGQRLAEVLLRRR